MKKLAIVKPELVKNLTPEEIRIMLLVRDGVTSEKGLAAALGKKRSTIHGQLQDAYRRLGVIQPRRGRGVRDFSIMIVALTKCIELGIVPGYPPRVDETRTKIYLLGKERRS